MSVKPMKTLCVMAALLALAAFPLPLLAQVLAQEFAAHPSEQNFQLYVGETQIIKLPSPVLKTAIGNGKVISTAMVSAKDLLIIANDTGRSSIYLWLKDKTEIAYSVEVGINSPSKIFAQVKGLLDKEDNINISLVGNRVFLQAQTLRQSQISLIDALQKAFPEQIVLISRGDVALEERMVHINAQLVEIKRSALEKLGVEWDSSTDGPSVGVVGDIASNRNNLSHLRPEGSNIADTDYTNKFSAVISLATAISSRINLLRQQGDAYIVAEPRLTARCGGKADFTSGGELPIPVQGGLGSTSVEFREYGVRLTIEPQCDKLGNIRAKVATEVSQIDPSVSVMGVPGLLTRKAQSELDLLEGQSMLLSGLASYSSGEGENRVPYLGRIPLLGHLFKTSDSHGERSELIVIITPNFITSESDVVKKSQERSKRLVNKTNEKLDEQDVKPLDWAPPPAVTYREDFWTEGAGVQAVLHGNTPLSANTAAPVLQQATPVSNNNPFSGGQDSGRQDNFVGPPLPSKLLPGGQNSNGQDTHVDNR